MDRIEFYINGSFFKKIEVPERIRSLSDAKRTAHKFMSDRVGGFSQRDITVSILERNDGINVAKIKIRSKELARDIVLEGLLKDG